MSILLLGQGYTGGATRRKARRIPIRKLFIPFLSTCGSLVGHPDEGGPGAPSSAELERDGRPGEASFMRRRSFLKLLGLSTLSAVASLPSPELAEASNGGVVTRQSLAGNWEFALDRSDVGMAERWFNRSLTEHIALPGILQGQGFGDEISIATPWVADLPRDMRWYLLPQYQPYTKRGQVKMPYLSQPSKHYLGVAWYQREIEIPAEWRRKRVQLTLERTRWETMAFVDGKQIGSSRSLVAPHIYDLGVLSPGKHRLSIRIDNRMILPYRPDGHSVSDAEGYSWNGMVGDVAISATSLVWIEDAQVYPNVAKKSARIKLKIGNATGKPGSGAITAGTATSEVIWDAAGGSAEIDVPLLPNAMPWSEFTPVLQHLAVTLTGSADADDRRELTFGLREVACEGKRMLLNGRQINIRATHNGGGYPIGGSPPTDVEAWKRVIGICKTWGLNGMRFHSWCPPEAAFTAADELGFYLQPECGMWNSFDAEGKMLAVLEDETARLLKAYGNHPSFLFLAASNEPAGHYREQLPVWDKKWRAADARRLYADGTGRPAWPAPGEPYPSDFVICPGTSAGRARGPSGWFGSDYEEALRDLPLPAVGHEIGQWCAYPNFEVIGKFTGYLQPGNYEIVRDFAAARGLLHRNQELAIASGRFQLACYKEEVEASLRTPSFSGFQLLDLHDYMGQGTALIGLLDPFWESKGYASNTECRRFCNTTVPLARVRRRVYTTAESLNATVEVAHFGAEPLANCRSEWRIEDSSGKVAARGDWPARDIPIGKGASLGKIEANLAGLPAPRQYRLVTSLPEAGFENDWNFWLYPEKVSAAVPEGVLITAAWQEAEARLQAGGKVLFQPATADLDSADPELSTVPIFWNRVMNPRGAWMLGLWCDTQHPALNGFPTEANCDWQWVDLIRGVHALNLNTLPPQLQPIVQPIDDWNRSWKFGLLYECTVGFGRLMVCSLDLYGGRPGAATLRRSILDYMGGDSFAPGVEIAVAAMRKQWVSTRPAGYVNPDANQTLGPTAPEVNAPGGVPAPLRAR